MIFEKEDVDKHVALIDSVKKPVEYLKKKKLLDEFLKNIKFGSI